MNYKIINIRSPILLLDKQRCLNNIKRISEKALKCGTEFRPHFKTHQSYKAGRWFRDIGIEQITVSSLRMAEYFAEDGWNDITVAFPVNILEAELINQLAKKIKLNILFSTLINQEQLRNIKEKLNYYIEIDCGDGRSGIKHDDEQAISSIIEESNRNPYLNFSGFLTHAGHTYKAKNRNEVLKVHKDSLNRMKQVKQMFSSEDTKFRISIGDTPSASIADDFSPADEIRPGNFIFYDWMQYRIGSCSLNDISLIAACPVVASYRDRNEAVIHGGAVHLSKDNIVNEDGNQNYGTAVYLTESGWEMPDNFVYIKKLSQEHGVLHVPESERKYINEGFVIGIIPIHSCLTADCMGRYMTEDEEMIEMMRCK